MVKHNMKVTFFHPIDKVWELVTDLSNQTWRSDLGHFEKIDENHFIEYTQTGIQTNFKVTKVDLYKLWELKFENKNLQGTWLGQFDYHDGQTVLDFTENVTVKNVILTPFVWLYLRKQQKQYFRDLEKVLEVK
ncbi:TPA: SRPBCC family protein [Streptococcus suis]|uniref:Polyketide cyclase n=1 Tax=Streptococcus porcorum TaxID=701526 RepID=A0ABV2JEY7_9STRE|nr:polyketide cyclase [Streptococcus suis]MBY4970948.1 SRPBCC family protein [Streptococcus suis]MBY5022137.1 SRPBCC family protein [Streptococcus suis]HEL9645612.1 SRPBCC family protein [Streptococcus suis]HEM2541868.1 SRPBCC family protein [Streptococcus suis]HEM5082685.1 SRPBCC family protein [Streptococcus suis]